MERIERALLALLLLVASGLVGCGSETADKKGGASGEQKKAEPGEQKGGEAEALEAARVDLQHPLVEAAEVVAVGVERVGVLHSELAQPQQAAAGAGLVAHLGGDLEERQRQLPGHAASRAAARQRMKKLALNR